MLASLVFDAVLSVVTAERTKPISVVCTDTRVEIPAIVEMVEGTLRQMQRCSQQNDLTDLNQARKPEKVALQEVVWVTLEHFRALGVCRWGS